MPGTPPYDRSQFDRPDLEECDVIMKGGITSGVVYPLAVCELAQRYRFRNVGGTSAGAIAAALTAAAEHGRGSGGFLRLAGLPGFLKDHLLGLFQPNRRTRPAFRVLLTWIGEGGWFRKTLATVVRIVLSLSGLLGFLLGAALGSVLFYLLVRLPSAGLHPRGGWLSWAVFALAWGLLGAAVAFGRAALSALQGNSFGLCTGMPGPRAKVPALTPWLADTLDETAGRDPKGDPLTFGDLWGTKDEAARRELNFEVMTTNLTWARPMRMPFETRELFFSPKELCELFPCRIVKWMYNHPAPGRDEREQEYIDLVHAKTPYRHMPRPADLPVVVAARMSLSFPVLFSAVPLYAVDWTRTRNAEAKKAGSAPELEKCWFSDGGIGSNFPVHFFDQLLPGRPTFGINLRPFHPDHPKDEKDERENVWFPAAAGQGIARSWHPIDGLFSFVGAILNTMQNWVDTAQTLLPGYRDRVVHVHLTEDEGGMNLSMSQKKIDALTARGQAAGQKLRDKFDWEGHRWTRYLNAMARLQDSLTKMEPVWSGFRGVLPGRDPDQSPYSRSGVWQQDAKEGTDELMQVVEGWNRRKHWFTMKPPKGPQPPSPVCDLRIMPRL